MLPNDRVAFVCPNPTTYLNDVQHPVPKNVKVYENIWYVDKESFQACKVGSPKGKGINQKWLNCDTPPVLKYDWLAFVPFNPANDLSLHPGTEHHFIGKWNDSCHQQFAVFMDALQAATTLVLKYCGEQNRKKKLTTKIVFFFQSVTQIYLDKGNSICHVQVTFLASVPLVKSCSAKQFLKEILDKK